MRWYQRTLGPLILAKDLSIKKVSTFELKEQNIIQSIEKLRSTFPNFVVFFFFGLFAFSKATPTAYGGSQPRGLIGAVAAKPTPEPQQRRI